MNILFLSYWGVNDGLTVATVYPHLRILADFSHISKIILVTVERDFSYHSMDIPQSPKIQHSALISKRPLPNILNKIYDFIDFPKSLVNIVRKEKIEKIIARGAPAGALALKAHKKTGIPFYCESFEPHSDYMYESGTWKWYDPRYIFQKKWEQEVIKRADALMPVAENYKNLMVAEGVPGEKIHVMPCCVPLDEFEYSEINRNETRDRIGFQGKIIGIYTGKFGGIYYQEESFSVFSKAFEFYGDSFALIILSPENPEWIRGMIKRTRLPESRVFIANVHHKDVPAYLSSANFAFTLIKPKRSNLYCSPIKNAEYWANGLPILMTAGVGDDSDIIETENAGAIFRGIEDHEGIVKGLQKIDQLSKEMNIRVRLKNVAEKHRNFKTVQMIYSKLFGN